MWLEILRSSFIMKKSCVKHKIMQVEHMENISSPVNVLRTGVQQFYNKEIDK